ncbi:MAG TPA: peptide chain release factor N(5)-glutamine methyltransferase, partial [Roseiarcus sp.]|nr:peptide chain release factor N(5)-glutamine methyltransferase [Roseiarcus sp.]
MTAFAPPCGATRGEALQALRAALTEAGIESPALDARLLVAAAAGLRREDLIREPDMALDEVVLTRLHALAARRIAREPVSRILGTREFWGLRLALTADVLDPRPETETLVEAALAAVASRRSEELRIVDLGAGSGAILCALLSELPNATGVAVEVSPKAAVLARDNLAAQGLTARSSVVVGHWGDALAERFDLVVSNPPYIARGEIDCLSPEVRRHDPLLALDGGADGLDAYRAIAGSLGRLLAPQGGFFLEIGATQGEAVLDILASAGMVNLTLTRDLAGHNRVAQGRGGRGSRQQAPWR